MIDGRFEKYAPYFGKWRISRELGRGAFGKVYEIYWEDSDGSRVRSAMKVMHIPGEEELRQQKEAQPDMEAVRRYFSGQVERIRGEIEILRTCRGHSNIVSYEDHLIAQDPEDDGVGWDILIRMELLYPLEAYFARVGVREQDVLRLWRDVANALVCCERQGIIHRDIKPANILVTPDGVFKLSDFGTARKSRSGQALSTRIGTDQYMAPEVYRGQRYDKRADFYSLGRVVYYYLNHNRHAFLPPYPADVDAVDYERAETRRIKGDKIPGIRRLPRRVNAALQRSLASRPQDRYKSAVELYRAVDALCGHPGDRLPLGQIALAALLLLGGAANLWTGLHRERPGAARYQAAETEGITEEARTESVIEEPETAAKNVQTQTQAEELETERQTEKQTERQTEKQREKQTEKQTERQSEGLTEVPAGPEPGVVLAEGNVYVSTEPSFAIGLDPEAGAVTAAKDDPAVLSGWLNAPPGTGVSVYLQIDGDPARTYNRDTLAELGGDLNVERTMRSLEQMEEALTGRVRYDEAEAGLVTSLRLPFLTAGSHQLRLTYSVSPPGYPLVTVDMYVSLEMADGELPAKTKTQAKP